MRREDAGVKLEEFGIRSIPAVVAINVKLPDCLSGRKADEETLRASGGGVAPMVAKAE